MPAMPPDPPAPGDRRGIRRSRQECPAPTGPLPDPASVQIFLVPDSAPPYDDEAHLPGGVARAAGRRPMASGRGGASGAIRVGGATQQPDRADRPGKACPAAHPAGGTAAHPAGPARRRGEVPGHGETVALPRWPSQFAQVLAETLGGSRPARQMEPWVAEHVRGQIQRLGARMATGQRPRVRRVITSCPAADVMEMTVVIGFGPRVRALAVRLERTRPSGAGTAPSGARARWLCTAVEAA